MNPRVSVVIVAFNRKDDVLETVSRLQTPVETGQVEVVVVDNCSSDGLCEMLKHGYPGVKVIRLPRNTGIEAYNVGISNASAPYVVILDDDSTIEPAALDRVVRRFESDSPDLACIAFCIKDYFSGKTVNEDWSDEPISFWGCGAAFRVEAVRKMEFYPPEFFLYHNEADLAIRLIDAGHRIVYDRTIVAHHKIKVSARLPARAVFFSTRNRLWYVWRNYPLYWAFRLTVREVVYQFFIAVREGQILPYFRALVWAVGGLPVVARRRRVVQRRTLERLLQTYWRVNRPPLYVALVKLLEQPSLATRKWGRAIR